MQCVVLRYHSRNWDRGRRDKTQTEEEALYYQGTLEGQAEAKLEEWRGTLLGCVLALLAAMLITDHRAVLKSSERQLGTKRISCGVLLVRQPDNHHQ
jgi:hypothetical protein